MLSNAFKTHGKEDEIGEETVLPFNLEGFTPTPPHQSRYAKLHCEERHLDIKITDSPGA